MARFALQLLNGLDYLHFRIRPRYLHCDIKSDNIFLSEYGDNTNLKIGDLDDPVKLDRFRDLQSKKTFENLKGTIHFCAPELIQLTTESSVKVGRKADMWSFGCVVLQMLQQGQFRFHNPGTGEDFDPFSCLS